MRVEAEPFAVGEARFERRRDERFEIAPAKVGVGIFAADDLALLGDPQSAVDAPLGLREDCVVARSAAAPDGAAASVEQSELDAMLAKRLDQVELRAIERPVRRQIAAVLVAVGIAEHHLLPVPPAFEHRAIAGDVERCPHDVVAPRKIVDRFEQRDDVEGERCALEQADFLQQYGNFQQVRDRLALGDDIVRKRLRAVTRANFGGGRENLQFGDSARRINEMRRMKQSR